MAFSDVLPSFSHDAKRDNVTLRFYSAFPGYVWVVFMREPSQNTKLKLLGVLLLYLKRSYRNQIRTRRSISKEPDCTSICENCPNTAVLL